VIRAIHHDRASLVPAPPDGAPYTEMQLRAADETPLFVRHYRAEHAPADRTLFIVHGMSEHGERYNHVSQVAAARGWNVVVSDLRGHGRSGGVPTHVDDFDRYLDDLEAVRTHFGLAPERTAILGHSMGGLLTALLLQRNSGFFSAGVLTSPLLAVKVQISRFTIALGKAAALVYPQTRFRSRVDQDHTTRNADVLAKRAVDPYIHRSVTAGWYFAMEAALKRAWAQTASIRCPLLLLQAGEDRIVDPDVPRPWLDQVASSDKTFRLYPEHYHELLNEPDWPETIDLILNWLEERVAAVAPRIREEEPRAPQPGASLILPDQPPSAS